jgi:hypothetical protein
MLGFGSVDDTRKAHQSSIAITRKYAPPNLTNIRVTVVPPSVPLSHKVT